jgi:hypothetical protein
MATDSSYASIAPSTSPRLGATVAVASMTNAQLSTWLFSDVSLGVTGDRVNNGMVTLLADGRASSIQDFADRQYARRQLGLGNGG